MKKIVFPYFKIKQLIRYFLLVSFLCCGTLYSKAQVFNGGFTAGLNFTQIDGDLLGGYTKLGANVGFISEMNIRDDWRLGFEILYSQKGSSSAFTTTIDDIKINWDYIDLPLLVKYHDWRGGFIFGAGLSLGRIVRSRYILNGADISETEFTERPLDDWDVNYVIDLSYMINDYLGFNLRGQYSMLSIREDARFSRFRNNAQFNNVISFRLLFIFSTFLQEK